MPLDLNRLPRVVKTTGRQLGRKDGALRRPRTNSDLLAFAAASGPREIGDTIYNEAYPHDESGDSWDQDSRHMLSDQDTQVEVRPQAPDLANPMPPQCQQLQEARLHRLWMDFLAATDNSPELIIDQSVLSSAQHHQTRPSPPYPAGSPCVFRRSASATFSAPRHSSRCHVRRSRLLSSRPPCHRGLSALPP